MQCYWLNWLANKLLHCEKLSIKTDEQILDEKYKHFKGSCQVKSQVLAINHETKCYAQQILTVLHQAGLLKGVRRQRKLRKGCEVRFNRRSRVR